MVDQHPTFRRSFGLLWLYTGLRVVLFAVVFGILWLVGVSGLLAAMIALVLTLPLSYVLLAKPRALLAANIEQRMNAHRSRSEELSARLNGDDED